MDVTTQPNYPCRRTIVYHTIDGIKRPFHLWTSVDLPFAIAQNESEETVAAIFQSAVETELEIIEEALRDGELGLVEQRLTGGLGWWGRVWRRLTCKPNHIVSWSRQYDDTQTHVHGTRNRICHFDAYSKLVYRYTAPPKMMFDIPRFDLNVIGHTRADAEEAARKAIRDHIDLCLDRKSVV